jgi:hypothetical protein
MFACSLKRVISARDRPHIGTVTASFFSLEQLVSGRHLLNGCFHIRGTVIKHKSEPLIIKDSFQRAPESPHLAATSSILVRTAQTLSNG